MSADRFLVVSSKHHRRTRIRLNLHLSSPRMTPDGEWVGRGYLISEEYGNVEFFAETSETFEHLIQFLLSFRKFSTTRIVDSK